MRPITPIQRACLIEATIEPLLFRRRGFARTKTGNFYTAQTVHALVKTGALRFIRNGRQVLVTARSA